MLKMEPSEQAIEWVDSSAIDLFQTCGRRFDFEIRRRLLPPGGPSHHLQVGAAVASAMDSLRKRNSLEAAIVALASSFPFDLALGPKSFPNCVRAVVAYAERFANHPVWEVVASEFSFTVEIPGHPDISYVGRVDALLRSKATGLLFVLDDKTSSRIGPSWIKKWTLRGQFIGYVWALRQLGYDVQGVVCRGIKLGPKPEIYEVGPIFVDNLIEDWTRKLSAITSLMKQGPYLPAFADHCSWCPWHDTCLYGTLDQARENPDPWDPVVGELPEGILQD